MLRTVMALPGGWHLLGDNEARPFLRHEDGRVLEPAAFASERDARDVYIEIKLEEDRRGRLHAGVEHDPDWWVIWKARVVIGIVFAEAKGLASGDKLFHEETEKLVRKIQRERALAWGG